MALNITYLNVDKCLMQLINYSRVQIRVPNQRARDAADGQASERGGPTYAVEMKRSTDVVPLFLAFVYDTSPRDVATPKIVYVFCIGIKTSIN